MPDLGKYADTVLSAYGISLLVLVGIVWLTWVQARRAQRRLNEVERRRGR